MTLGELLQYQKARALTVKLNATTGYYEIGGQALSLQDMQFMCRNLGWTEFYLPPNEIITKTNKYVKAFKPLEKNEHLMNLVFEFQNKRSNEYGKTFDRVHIVYPNIHEFSIIHGMSGIGASYVLYNSKTGAPEVKSSGLKTIVEHISTIRLF